MRETKNSRAGRYNSRSQLTEHDDMVTQERLKELFDYDAHTGNLIWKVRRQRIKVGDVAGYTKESLIN